MLSITQMIQLALGFLKLANWITTKIDRAEWKRLGYEEAIQEQLRLLNTSLKAAEQAVQEAKQATPEARHKSLKDPT